MFRAGHNANHRKQQESLLARQTASAALPLIKCENVTRLIIEEEIIFLISVLRLTVYAVPIADASSIIGGNYPISVTQCSSDTFLNYQVNFLCK